MENQNVNESMKTKRLLIICGCIIVVAAIALIGVLVLKDRNENSLPDFLDQAAMVGIEEMTFEQYSMGMRKDLPAETLEEAKRLFEELQQASADGDAGRMNEINMELARLDLFDFDLSNMQSRTVMAFDAEGNPVDPEDFPEEIKELLGK